MKICFTVCSLNRLGQIITLHESIKNNNPEYKFVACLADEVNGRINVNDFPEIQFISLSDLKLEEQNELSNKYSIFELSCALKSYFSLYILKVFNPEIIIYFDTDIYVFDRLTGIEKYLIENSVIITPHILQPIPNDGKVPYERDILKSGLYNGGFLALKNDTSALKFLQWWQSRLRDQGYNNIPEGMMVDQLWLNLVPLYFENVHIVNDPEYNVAYWNLHERTLIKKGQNYFVNGSPLIFFHFSGYRLTDPLRLSIHQNRFDENSIPALMDIITSYRDKLIKNQFEFYTSITPLYGIVKNKNQFSIPKRIFIKALAKMGYALEKIKKV